MMAALGAILVVMAVVDTFKPAEPSKASTPVSAVSPAVQQEKQEIEQFAYIVTKPLDELTSEDIDFMGVKAKDPCYEKYAELPSEQMIAKIAACKETG